MSANFQLANISNLKVLVKRQIIQILTNPIGLKDLFRSIDVSPLNTYSAKAVLLKKVSGEILGSVTAFYWYYHTSIPSNFV